MQKNQIVVSSIIGIGTILFAIAITQSVILSHQFVTKDEQATTITSLQNKIEELQSEVNILSGHPPLAAHTTSVSISKGESSQNCAGSYSCHQPYSAMITVGDTVTWTNKDDSAHTITSGNPSDNPPNGLFDSGFILSGKTWSHTFTQSGTFNYFCEIHPWSTGQIVVEPRT